MVDRMSLTISRRCSGVRESKSVSLSGRGLQVIGVGYKFSFTVAHRFSLVNRLV